MTDGVPCRSSSSGSWAVSGNATAGPIANSVGFAINCWRRRSPNYFEGERLETASLNSVSITPSPHFLPRSGNLTPIFPSILFCAFSRARPRERCKNRVSNFLHLLRCIPAGCSESFRDAPSTPYGLLESAFDPKRTLAHCLLMQASHADQASHHKICLMIVRTLGAPLRHCQSKRKCLRQIR